MFVHQLFFKSNNSNHGEPDFVMFDVPVNVSICREDDDVMSVKSVNLVPDPPSKGSNVSIVIDGYLNEDILPGAYMMVSVNKGGFKLPQIKIPICDYIKSNCPVDVSSERIEMIFEIPKMLPSGTYDVKAVLFNNDVDIFSRKIIGMTNLANDIHGEYEQSYSTYKKYEPVISMIGKRVTCVEGSLQL